MRRTVETARRIASAATVPAFFLYGEPLQAPDERVIHVETVAARSLLHDWMIHPHRHRDLHQVLLTQRGRVDVRLDGCASALRAPAAIVVPRGVVHGFRFQPDTDGLVISFAPGLARELAAPNPALLALVERAAAVELDRTSRDVTDLWPLGQMLLREFGRSAPGRHVALRGLLGAVLANALRLLGPAGDRESPPSADRQLVARFREQIERRFRDHASLREYASALRVSDGRLRRACLSVIGEPPLAVVHLRLLVEAERQLRYTSMTIAQVAYYLGFEDPAYFSRFFTRRMGVSPRAFRAGDGFELQGGG